MNGKNIGTGPGVILRLAFAFSAIMVSPSKALSWSALRSSWAAPLPAVILRAASEAALPFVTQNGAVVDGDLSQAYDLPHLVLYRNGALTPPDERTLILELTGIKVPRTGVTVTPGGKRGGPLASMKRRVS